MGIATGVTASASGLTAQRLRMDVIADNIANASTTRTSGGGPFRRRLVLFQARESGAGSWCPMPMGGAEQGPGQGVRVVGIEEDQSPLRRVHDPGHPEADAEGYVDLPNIHVVREMVDLISATRAYEANVSAISSAKEMASRALEIGA